MFLIRLLIVGDTSVGKTSLLVRFNENHYVANQKTTIGVDYKAKEMTIDGEEIKLQIWDTAGQERFRSMTSAFYNRAQGVVITFDVGILSSFVSLKTWIADVIRFAPRGCVIVLCANKVDMPPEKYQVRPEDYKAFANENSFTLFEASAVTGLNVEEMFVEISRQILLNNRASLAEVKRPSSESVVLFNQESRDLSKSKGRCC